MHHFQKTPDRCHVSHSQTSNCHCHSHPADAAWRPRARRTMSLGLTQMEPTQRVIINTYWQYVFIYSDSFGVPTDNLSLRDSQIALKLLYSLWLCRVFAAPFFVLFVKFHYRPRSVIVNYLQFTRSKNKTTNLFNPPFSLCFPYQCHFSPTCPAQEEKVTDLFNSVGT